MKIKGDDERSEGANERTKQRNERIVVFEMIFGKTKCYMDRLVGGGIIMMYVYHRRRPSIYQEKNKVSSRDRKSVV